MSVTFFNTAMKLKLGFLFAGAVFSVASITCSATSAAPEWRGASMGFLMLGVVSLIMALIVILLERRGGDDA